ncbi:MAG: hypothetical protein JWQ40_3726 [Segetibacter sp.]|jgi:hypothetical protein|nr:hypothetical protein [Segetibacter sp.]
MSKRRRIVVAVIFIIAGYWLLQKLDFLPSLKNIFKAKPVVIDETPILIKEIKSIGQLITFSSFDEVVVDSNIVTRGSRFVNSFNTLAPIPVLPSADKQIVLIGRGKVLAGTDLSLLTDSSLSIRNDTLSLFLPKPQIFEAILNPSDFETFVEKGEWSNEEVTLVKIKARRKMTDRALQQNILGKAGQKSKAIMEDFLGNMGYKKVLIY